MKVIKNSKVVFCDVDDTLIKPFPEDYEEGIKEVDFFGPYKFAPIESNIDAVKQLKVHGYEIYVWSHSGAELASKIIKELGLEDSVDYVLSKPRYIFDDMLATIPPGTKLVWLNSKNENIYEPVSVNQVSLPWVPDHD
jgi:hypothetical protein